MNLLQLLLGGIIGWMFTPEAPTAPLACNLSVMTNPSEITICNPGTTISLNAVISGGIPQVIQWTPTTGVANPNSANTTAVVNNSMVYQVNVTALSSDNLIFNGNFNAGAVGFTSDYIPGTGGAFGLLSLEGQYAVSTNPMFTHTNFASCDDHSPGTGNMMVVNGAGVANQDVWCQVVNVTPNTNYGFSAWIASVVASSPAQLQFSVNGGIIGGTYMASSSTCVWTEFFQTWNSGPTGMAEICIVNQNTALSGNDFAIDDIFFAEICQATDIVTVTLVDLDATWFPPGDLCQSSPPFLLNSLLAPFATPGGTWTINGNPSTIFDPVNLGVGAHQVRYTVTQGGCTESFTDVIVVLPLPSASWAPPFNLCTTGPTFNLNTLLLPGAEQGGVWRVNGVISTTFNPAQLGPGDHFVTYTVGTAPCINQESGIITISPLPEAAWTVPQGLCSNSPSFALNTLLDPGSQSGGVWRVNGTIATVFNPATLGAGTHTVSYTVGTPPCAAAITQSIVVGLTPAVPQPTCEVSGQNEIVFSWPAVPGATSYDVDVVTGQSGGILSGTTFTLNNLLPGETATIRVMANGTGGCESAWSAPVSCTTISCMQPFVMIQEVANVCFDSMAPSFTLTAVVNDMSGTGVWSGTGITNTMTGLFSPVVAGVGVHAVYYTYTLNGCSARDTAQILVQAPAVLDFALDTTICVGDTATVTFTGMASDTAVFTWNFDGAMVVSGSNSGPYQLIWSTSGDRTVQLIVQDGACPADTISRIIRVEALLSPPEILCRTTLSSVEFYWEAQPEVESYSASIINGPAGMMSSDTSFIVTGLLPGEMVEISLSAESATACPDTSAQRTCVASDCPDVIITLITPAPICLMPNSGNIQLMATIQGGLGNGTGVWHGTGITDTLLGIFRPALALIGDNLITYTYTEGNCTYTEDATIEVNRRPSSFFEADSVICLTSTATLTYTGDAPATATFTWGLDGGVIESGSGIGPLVVSWPTPGIKNVRLVVENGGCTSVPFFQDVQVDPEVEIPLIQCISTINSVEFYWNDVPNSAAYVINLIQGPVGMITSDTSYRMMNLLPDQEVIIQMTTFSSNACPGSVQLSNCQALPCPDVQLDAPPISTCFEGVPDTLMLQVTAMGGTGMGTIAWSGEGIINGQQNLFVTHAGMVGRTIPVAILYREGACDYRDTLLVQVNPVPTPDFTIGAEPCENGETTITYTGTASAQADFQWSFGADATVTGTGAGPYQVSWPNAGTQNISLQIEDGCTSPLLQQSVEVLAPLPPPVITCEATYTEITFSWQPVPGTTNFEVNVLDGMPGMLVNDTSYVIQNLQPGDATTVEVIISDNGPCPPESSELTCETLLCPAVQLSIDPVAPICFDGTTDTLNLVFSLSGDSPQGTLQWSGAGIFDANTPDVMLTTAMIGQQNTVRATYTESVCVYSDSISIDLRAVPVAAFTADPLICNSDASVVAFTGSATNGAVYNWNFDGGQATPGTNAGPHQVRWNDAGQYEVSLWITDAGCLSDTFSLSVQVDEPLVSPVLNCVPDYDNLTISWPSVAGATNYDLQLPAGIGGTALSDTVFVIENLQPGTSVAYTLMVFGNTICGPISVSGSCSALVCPERSLTWSAPQAICRGDVATIQFDLNGNTGNPWQITFSDGSMAYNFSIVNDTSIQLSPTATSTFTVTAISDPSLTICNIALPAAITTIVNLPVEAGTALPAPEFCTGENGTVALATLLQGADAGGIWSETSTPSSSAGAFNAATGTFNIANQAAGTYRFRYQMNAIAPCLSDFAEVSVVINPTPRADAGADQSLDCLTEIASLGGPLTTIRPGLVYQWQSNNGAVVAQPAQPITETMQAGSFTLVVTDPITGCRSQDVMQVIDRVNELNLFAHAQPATCLNERGAIFVDSVTGGALPYAFSLNGAPFVLQQAFASLEPGSYNLVAQDATGCVTELDLQIEAATTLDVELIANLIDEPYTITLGDSTELTALVNIPLDQVQDVRWQPADSVRCVGCLEQTVQPFYTSTYVVTVTDVNGCVASDNLTIFVRRERDIFIPNVFSPNGDGLNDVFMIFGGRQVRQVKSFLVFTRWGESIFQNYNFQPNDPAHGWNGIFRNLKMNSGVFVYFAEVEFIDGEVLIYKGDVTLLN